MWTGKWTVSSRRGSRRTWRMPGSRFESLGGQVELALGDLPWVDRAPRRARSSWRRRPPCRAAPVGAAASVWVVSRTTPRGAIGREDPASWRPGRDARLMCDREYSRGGPAVRLPDGTGRQGCRNRAATSLPVADAGSAPVQRPPRRRSRARGAVRPRPDQLDRHARRDRCRRQPGNDLVTERRDVGRRGVQDREPLDRPVR